MNATKPLAVLVAVLLVGTGAAAAAGSSYETGTESYAMNATLDDGTVTVTVERGGAGVANATVRANDERVGTTDANGTVSFETNAGDELELTAEGDGFEMKAEFAVENGALVLEKSEFERKDAGGDSDAGDDSDAGGDSDAGDAAGENSDDANDERAQGEQKRAEQAGGTEGSTNADASASAAASAENRGPPSELPDAASDRASSVHGVIDDFLSGDVANLGQALSSLVGGGNAANQ